LVVQTMSKSRALAGLRIGYAIGDADLIEALTRVKDSFNSYPLGRPAHSRSHQIRDRYPGASDISSPPCLPRLLPAGAIAGWALHPLEKRRLVTAHVESGSSRFCPACDAHGSNPVIHRLKR
jgi:hypothetical protein